MKKKILLVLCISIAIFITYIAFSAFTNQTKRLISSIVDYASPSFTGTFSVGKSGTDGYVYLYPNDSPPACSSSTKGTIYSDDSENRLKFCNGTKWVVLEY